MPQSSLRLIHHYLKPGEMLLTEKPVLVSTILGSCITVTMFSRRQQLAAMCHGLLPTCRNNACCRCPESFRYVECSIKRMAAEFRKRGVAGSETEVKMFGGSDMFKVSDAHKDLTIGNQNIKFALEVLESEGLVLSACDVGGTRGRKIFFNSRTGEVQVKLLGRK